MNRLLILLLSLQISSCLFGENQSVLSTSKQEQNLQSFLTTAKKGDYIVTKSGKLLSLISIRSIDSKILTLEEISAPVKNINPIPKSWAEWVKNKAPGHSSWSILEIDLETGQISKCYSLSRGSYVQITQKESLFATLLQLPLHPVPMDKRRRIGPPPSFGESDFRKLWQPSFIFEGQLMEKSDFIVLETTWPKDGSELEGKEMLLYFDKQFRIALPYWIQIETPHAIGHFHAIDCGKNLVSPVRNLPAP